MNRLKETTDSISNQLLDALVALQLLESIEIAWEMDHMVNDSEAWLVIYEMAKREMYMALSRALDKHRDAASIPFLLNYAQHNPKEFVHLYIPEGEGDAKEDPGRRIEELVAKWTAWYDGLSHRQTIVDIRDKVLAHLDKGPLFDPGKRIGGIPKHELEQLLGECCSLIDDFRKWIDETYVHHLAVRNSIAHDMGHLTRCHARGMEALIEDIDHGRNFQI